MAATFTVEALGPDGNPVAGRVVVSPQGGSGLAVTSSADSGAPLPQPIPCTTAGLHIHVTGVNVAGWLVSFTALDTTLQIGQVVVPDGSTTEDVRFMLVSAIAASPSTNALNNVRVLIPRLRRAIDGPAASSGLAALTMTDDMVKDAAADALADVQFYTGGVFGHKLLVLARDPTYNAPSEWAVDPALAPEEETVIVAQAAINFYFHYFKDLKVDEAIANEGQSWDYKLSANVLKAQFDQLVAARDRALEQVERNHPVPTVFAGFLEARDYLTARLIEPWTGVSGFPILPQGVPSGLEAVERFGP